MPTSSQCQNHVLGEDVAGQQCPSPCQAPPGLAFSSHLGRAPSMSAPFPRPYFRSVLSPPERRRPPPPGPQFWGPVPPHVLPTTEAPTPMPSELLMLSGLWWLVTLKLGIRGQLDLVLRRNSCQVQQLLDFHSSSVPPTWAPQSVYTYRPPAEGAREQRLQRPGAGLATGGGAALRQRLFLLPSSPEGKV